MHNHRQFSAVMCNNTKTVKIECKCENCACDKFKADAQFEELIKNRLINRPKWFNILGIIVFVFGCVIAWYFIDRIQNKTIEQMQLVTKTKIDTINMRPVFSFKEQQVILEPAKDSNEITGRLIYLGIRTTGLSLLITSILYYVFRLAFSLLDAGERTNKRINAAKYLQFLYMKHGNDIKKEVTITELMNAFEVWNQNIETAFSNNKNNQSSKDDNKK